MHAIPSKIFITLIGSFFILKPALSDSELDCKLDKYSSATASSIEVIESFVPKSQQHLIKNNKQTTHLNFGFEGTVTEDTKKLLKFRYRFVQKTANVNITYIFFRTNNKISVHVKPEGYWDMGPIWGFCTETKDVLSYELRLMNTTDEKVCRTVLQALHASSEAAKGTSKDTIHFNSKPFTDYMAKLHLNSNGQNFQFEGWINEAKKRWGNDYSSNCKKILG